MELVEDKKPNILQRVGNNNNKGIMSRVGKPGAGVMSRLGPSIMQRLGPNAVPPPKRQPLKADKKTKPEDLVVSFVNKKAPQTVQPANRSKQAGPSGGNTLNDRFSQFHSKQQQTNNKIVQPWEVKK
jgi:hypothetical protein